MMKILILGGSGFLGRAIFTYLKSFKEVELVCGDIVDPQIKGVTFLFVDILDQKSSLVIRNCFDIIINCIGQVTNPINLCYTLNSQGIDNIIDAVINTKTRIVHISSVSIYGSCQIADEHSPFNPETPYSTCKAYAEYLLSSKLNIDQLAIVRLSNLYGPTQEKGILSYLIRSYTSDRKLYFNNDGSLVRYYLHVEDCVTNFCKLFLDKSNFKAGVYNLLGKDRFTVIELIKVFEDIGKVMFTKNFELLRPYDNTIEILDNDTKDNLQLEFSHSLEAYIDKEILR